MQYGQAKKAKEAKSIYMQCILFDLTSPGFVIRSLYFLAATSYSGYDGNRCNYANGANQEG